jgi:hypothetical protein
MGSFLWFMFGLWIGGTVGFVLFACLQMSRDALAMLNCRSWMLTAGIRASAARRRAASLSRR